MKLNDKIQKAIEETVNNAVDAVCERGGGAAIRGNNFKGVY